MTTESIQNRRVIIITGVNGDLGREYAARLENQGNLYGISRKPKQSAANYKHICADLLNPMQVQEAFGKIEPTHEIIYLHLVGKFKFEDDKHPIEDSNRDGLDDEIYATNFTTFLNVLPHLKKFLDSNPKTKLKVVGIGSVSDLYKIPFWSSFSASKEELRKAFRRLYGEKDYHGRVSTLMVNVSTVSGSQLDLERPFISKAYCLNPKEVVDLSIDYILDNKLSSLELSLVKPHPSFSEEDFLSIALIRDRWYKDMYGPDFQRIKGGI